MSGGHHERGLALVVVLWVVSVLSLIAAAMLSSALNSARIGHNTWSQIRLQTAADSGVQTAILSLFDPDPRGRLALDGRSEQMQIDGAKLTVSVQDETGRIDLNYASRDLLRNYFKAAGLEPNAADALADHVIDWRSPKGTQSLNGAGRGDYEHAGYTGRPRGAPFQSVDELRLVIGMTPELFDRVAPGLTVYSHVPNFDNRFAPSMVLQVIPGVGPSQADAIIAARRSLTAPRAHAYTIRVTAERGQVRFTRRAVVQLTADPQRPYWILDWK